MSTAKCIPMLSQIAEVHRMASAIDKSLPDASCKSLVVGSACPQEGKTLMTAALAYYWGSLNQQSILAMDGHWYKPALHQCFDLDQTFSLHELQQSPTPLQLVHTTCNGYLHILPAPTYDPQENTHSEPWLDSALRILHQAKTTYDIVLIDSSPILSMNRNMLDPISLTKAADGMLLVVKTWTTPRERVKKGKMAVETSGGKVLGAMVNQCQNPMMGS